MKRMGWLGIGLLLVMTWSAQGQERLAIVGATIIDGNGGAPIANGTVVIDGGLISAVGSRGSIDVPRTRARSTAAARSSHRVHRHQRAPPALWRPCGSHSFDVSPDGQRFLMVKNPGKIEAHLVLNWTTELEKLVPTDR